jgi:hypothetical protein
MPGVADTARGSLLYVATGSDVFILSYPSGKSVGDLGLSGHDLCSDTNGNVFIPTSDYQVREFSHAGKPLQTLQAGDVPLACAVDPMTGNLAVTNEGSGAGEVAVFANSQGTPQFYRDSAIQTYGQCGYDDNGDLFVDGSGSGGAILAELAKGSDAFTNFSLDSRFVPFGSVQWDGKHITITNPAKHTLYALSIAKSLTVVSTTHFRAWNNSYSGGWPYVQTWLQGGTFIAQSTTTARLGLWNYARGGDPTKRTSPFESGATTISGVTVSVAPRKV